MSNASLDRGRPAGETAGSAQRPARHLTGPLLAFDLAPELASLKAETSWQRGDRNARTLVEEPGLRIVLMATKAGARVREHSTRGLVSLQALAGLVRLHLPDRTVDLPAGHLLAMHHEVPHELEALEESVVLLTVAWPTPGTPHA